MICNARSMVVALSLFSLAACQPDAPPPAKTEAPKPVLTYDTARPSGDYSFTPEITAADFSQHVRILASDEFQGRSPGTLGERMTTAYLEDQFLRLGLTPAFKDTYLQAVPTLEITPDANSQLEITVADSALPLNKGPDYVVGSVNGLGEVQIEGSDLVFVGFGVNAPEYGWNDYQDLDVKGKTVVVLINDPGFETNDASLFRGKAMTYYGRWTYKFEEAARQGAAGCLIIHDTAGAGYDWSVVQNSWSGPEFTLQADDDKEPRLAYRGWLNGAKAEELFSKSGLNFAEQRALANRAGFKAQALNAKASAKLKNSLRTISANNAVAMIKGASKPDEAIVYSAHWDHLGVDDKIQGEDHIFNGAVDNATGVSALLEIAEKIKSQATPPARSVIFVFTTLEESGLLGSRYYAANPAIPMEKTLANINIDAMPTFGRTRDMTVIGYGQSNLEDILAESLKAQDRVIAEEHTPEKGFFFRSDHFNFARQGVPALYARAGWNLRDGGEAAGKAAADEHGSTRYHKVGDEFSPQWPLDGTIEDVQALYQVGLIVANGDAWPVWKAGSEFKAIREAQAQP